jgi:hypothetical protein
MTRAALASKWRYAASGLLVALLVGAFVLKLLLAAEKHPTPNGFPPGWDCSYLGRGARVCEATPPTNAH